MADWKDYYQQHLKTMDEVVGEVKSGDALWFGAATEIPYAFLEKLHDRRRRRGCGRSRGRVASCAGLCGE